MKKILTIIFILIISLSFAEVKALCNDVEINDLAERFTYMYADLDNGDLVSYDSTRTAYSDDYTYVIFLYPYSEKFKVIASDSITNEKREIKSDDILDAFSIPSYVHYEPKKYNIELYGADNTVCKGELLKTFSFEVPKFNEYSMYEHCQKNQDEDICTKMSNTSNISFEEYEKIVEKSKEDNKIKNMSLKERLIYYSKKYCLYAIIPILLISIYYTIKINKYKKKVENQ